MIIYDFAINYFYNHFRNKGYLDPVGAAIPYVSGLLMVHLIFIIVLANHIAGFNLLIELFGAKSNQGKYYSLPAIIVFLIFSHFIVKKRFATLQFKRKLSELTRLNSQLHTIVLIAIYIIPIFLSAILV